MASPRIKARRTVGVVRRHTSVARDAVRWRVLIILAGGFALRSLFLRVKRVFVFAEHAGFDEDVVEEFPEVRDEGLPLLGRLRT